MRILWALFALTAAGCDCGDDEKKGECDQASECENHQACIAHDCAPCVESEDCGENAVCDSGPDGAPGCYEPVVIRGRVFDLETGEGIGGARIVAIDANGAPTSSVAISEADGSYELGVPTERNAEGLVVGAQVTLRADASGYQTFPGGIRQALPIDTTAPVESEETDDADLVVQSALTDIGLLAMPAGSGTGSIHGVVAESEDALYGTLVVAETGGVGKSGIADRDGEYAIFNLDAGDYSVQGYARGVVYEAAAVTLGAAEDLQVDLALSGDATATLDGSIQIVNGGAGNASSVILVVESTFDEALKRGDAPPGLRAPEPGITVAEGGISGGFTIDGIPPGRYVILAAFENDFLVRDPDTCISGTDILYQEFTAGQLVDNTDGFKVTGSLDVISPGAEGPEAVTGNPTLSWVDDSSEDEYHVAVFDSFGEIIWETDIPGESGGDPAVTYGGPALEEGMYYQFRATSLRTGGGDTCEISRTEDLKGVFFVAPPAEG